MNENIGHGTNQYGHNSLEVDLLKLKYANDTRADRIRKGLVKR